MSDRPAQPETGADVWQIQLFAGLRIVRNGAIVARFRQQRPGALLAYLAYYTGRAHSRDELTEVLWPDIDPTAGRNRLKQTLYELRDELQSAGIPLERFLLADRMTIWLNAGEFGTDVAEFEAACRAAASAPSAARPPLLERAIELCRGPLLPGFYQDWVGPERERLATALIDCLLDLAAHLEARGDVARATEYGRRAVALDPLREEAHCALIRALAASGRRTEAIRQYRTMARHLEELGQRPSSTAQALLQQIEAVAAHIPLSSPPVAPPAAAPPDPVSLTSRYEPVGGAVPLNSRFYIIRETDREFASAIDRRDSIVLVKGPRQVGKTSLLARGLQQARLSGARVVLTDLQQFTSEQVGEADLLFRALADSIVEQLDLEIDVRARWDADRGWNVNFERILRRDVLQADESPLVWGLDEVDRLFFCTYGNDVFGLFRSWHNLRSLHPNGPWSRLTLAMAYATEAHLFIADLNQSPFNVGTRLLLEDFTREQVEELNHRYDSPLKTAEEVTRFFELVGGCPYLVRRGLHTLVTKGMTLDAFTRSAPRQDGPFHDHLERMLRGVTDDPALLTATQEVLREGACRDADRFYRLSGGGVLTGEPEAARLRCRLYRDYLRERLV